MQIPAHIIIVDGSPSSGKKLFCLELAITLMHNNQNIAILLDSDSPLQQTIHLRKNSYPELPTPAVIEKKDFEASKSGYDAIIIPCISPTDELAQTANTFITILNSKSVSTFKNNKTYINKMWELKKQIASQRKTSLNWVVIENHLKDKLIDTKSKELQNLSKMYGFRIAPPINKRLSYQNTLKGISSQDKTLDFLKKTLTYEDICAKREITKLAE
ncbi:MAG: hypothetical protein IKW39_04150, partial [Alphaproteobacteria bacterium]|nr:hypothetical protein [Alphaproteobacteria bacterium]